MIIKKQIVVDVLPTAPSAGGYMLLHVIESSSKTDVIKYMVDTHLLEFLQMFNWTVRYRLDKSNRPTSLEYPYYSALLPTGEFYKKIELFKVILGIYPSIKCKVIFRDGNKFNYMRSNLMVIDEQGNPLQYQIYHYRPNLPHLIFPCTYSGIEARNHANDAVVYRVSARISGIEYADVLVNWRFVPILNQYSWAVIRGTGTHLTTISSNQALTLDKNGNRHHIALMHRFIMQLEYPFFDMFDTSIFIDHIDRNPLNNCIENMRFCTHAQNCMNRIRHDNLSGYPGVLRTKNKYKKWQVVIREGGNVHNLGSYERLKDAVEVRNEGVRKYHGEFAVVIPYRGEEEQMEGAE